MLVAGIGGLVIGHMLWLIAISLAISTTAVSSWVLIVSAVIAGAERGRRVLLGWRRYRRKVSLVLGGVPVVPARYPPVLVDADACSE